VDVFTVPDLGSRDGPGVSRGRPRPAASIAPDATEDRPIGRFGLTGSMLLDELPLDLLQLQDLIAVEKPHLQEDLRKTRVA